MTLIVRGESEGGAKIRMTRAVIYLFENSEVRLMSVEKKKKEEGLHTIIARK